MPPEQAISFDARPGDSPETVPTDATEPRSRDRVDGPVGGSARDDGTGPAGPVSEDLHIRNYDTEWAYDLDLRVLDTAGEEVYRRQYHLRPGAFRSEVGVCAPGEYSIEAVIDHERGTSERCRIDGSPEGTALVEIGNGVVSVTEGIYGVST